MRFNHDISLVGGGGSGSVVPYYQITPLQGVVEALGYTFSVPTTGTCTIEVGLSALGPFDS
jgi:hypothetical protein